MASTKYIPVIGMEVHAELKTTSKMFCRCVNDFGLEERPNVNVCPVCLGHPGALPTANVEAIKMVIKVGLALGADIARISKFDRKNYFYPDLPKGYQISQYDQPLTEHGSLEANGKPIAITRVHLEEDTGKLQHPEDAPYSLVDFNRSGVPLMELVTEPDITSSVEAKKFCQELQLLLRTLDVSGTDMEKGQMRCEANISLMQADKERKAENYGTKVEVKNLNSFKAVERAIEYEISRQESLLEAGEPVLQETRGWNDAQQKTYAQRSKESAHDYRYFPEPDLPPLVLGSLNEDSPKGAVAISVDAIRETLPELPQQRRARFMEEFSLSNEDAYLLTADPALASFTESVFAEMKEWVTTLDSVEGSAEEIWGHEIKKISKLVGGWLTSELFKLMKESKTTISGVQITASSFANFLKLVYERRANSSAAQIILREMFSTGKDAQTVLEEKDLGQVDDNESLDAVIEKIITANPDPVKDYMNGKENALQYLVGQGMKQTKGKANPEKLRELFKKRLSS
ncbi:Asp-tRNA(Asn)/Glu-tRNA(Gln) amidotransferase subunit GatB [Candidatus Uhrbacteria bacterium CG10_big_fil_rev_8_21_14_0_10_48_11]|uniref:Aspartyl/glutamyl-tRNA(Asn/Gln) amidotransferase subunit B n=1 Tax=Candidatus Uhrbacteria bacterium CG10_big_fil_rev_8_21_14_0_10_48_11 TaxID=1975037 RepID=A0A2M8LDW4_9BACT|nr:MAG: Asp-tRNA(Asn)/Glu-tRNA(Gln) amidotransferase subunit GatB [Candidatus Uhrbacteria bacterium CG10_big_fil_rev_8_21_14_0_10_48_11]